MLNSRYIIWIVYGNNRRHKESTAKRDHVFWPDYDNDYDNGIDGIYVESSWCVNNTASVILA